MAVLRTMESLSVHMEEQTQGASRDGFKEDGCSSANPCRRPHALTHRFRKRGT